MRIMIDPQCPARCLPFSCTMYELLLELTAETRGTSCANGDGNDWRYSGWTRPRLLCRINNVGFEARCGSWHSSLRHHAARKRQ